ncbi:MAG: UvrD-helicase domain-containing protein, partial [Rhodoplanes sp.]
MLEAQDVVDFGAAPAIDRLVVVADAANVFLLLCCYLPHRRKAVTLSPCGRGCPSVSKDEAKAPQSAPKNICCVGDDDQSIYSWRGAEIGNILRFESDFPGATIIRLEENYRSTSHILGAAAGMMVKNRGRLGKTLWTRIDGGDKVVV